MFEQKINNLIGKKMPRAIGGQKGYTLIEIVMVIVILGVIGAFTFQFVAHGVQAFKKSSARKDLYDQGRLALERMVRELGSEESRRSEWHSGHSCPGLRCQQLPGDRYRLLQRCNCR
jgi:prepilin-type N-terminal cleavage/methylation domain-containing protein